MNPWWAGQSGQRCLTYFQAWGLVRQERELSGDDSAVPRTFDGQSGARNLVKGSLPGILDKFIDVDTWLKRKPVKCFSLLEFIYVRNLTYQSAVRYKFADGSTSEWLTQEAEPPKTWESVDRRDILSTQPNLSAFACAETLAFCAVWGENYETVLNREHLRLARKFAFDKKL